MLVNFIGAPNSGKTTIAASVFAKLKTMGIPAEFIGEKARETIAKLKYYGDNMSNKAQATITYQQANSEKYFNFKNPNPVICDSSVLLTLLYITSDIDKITLDIILGQVKESIKEMQHVFYCPVKDFGTADPNRIHNMHQSLEIDKKIKPLFEKYAPHIKIHDLSGSIDECTEKVISVILEK
jgi:hypothetical protein